MKVDWIGAAKGEKCALLNHFMARQPRRKRLNNTWRGVLISSQMGDTLQLEHGPAGKRSEDGAGAWSWLEESSDLWGNAGVSHRT